MSSSPSVSAAKGEPYYANGRADVITMLRRPVGRVLDVGCGAGATAPGLRRAGATEIVGVEPVPDAAERASGILDGRFDSILCLDVVEHLVDPAVVVARLRALARPGAQLQVSVPNARHYSLVRDLVLRGAFGYMDWGHRDGTHLRWFTRRDIVALIGAAGRQVTATGVPPLGRSAGLHKLTGGWSSEFLVAQVYVTAVNSG